MPRGSLTCRKQPAKRPSREEPHPDAHASREIPRSRKRSQVRAVDSARGAIDQERHAQAQAREHESPAGVGDLPKSGSDRALPQHKNLQRLPRPALGLFQDFLFHKVQTGC